MLMVPKYSLLLTALAVTACGDDRDPGALLAVSMESTIGVLIEDVPLAARERAIAQLQAQPATFWETRIKRQIEMTSYRLVFRNLYFEPEDGKGILPLPPVETWSIELIGTPGLRTIDGHPIVAVDYVFTSTLLGPEDEAVKADARLANAGDAVTEEFVLPVDPEHLLERTGYACMNESDFPPNSVDTENARLFYDDLCEGATLVDNDGCHLTAPIPSQSCVEAVQARVGSVATTVRFERIPWNEASAEAVRVGSQLPGVAELRAMPEGVEDHRIVYRYFPEDSCAITEGCVGGAGWRRLLQFTATVQNLGAEDAAIGDVGEGSGPVANNLVSYSECHGHMHFNHYGKFTVGSGNQQLGSKRAFCLESTWRYYNNEDTPFTHPYTCEFQGTAAGWGDDYIAGLDCQWVDITPIDTTASRLTSTLGFEVNPDRFLCEGSVKTDGDGEPLYEPTAFMTEAGAIEHKIACDETDDAFANNVVTTAVELPRGTGGLVTEACTRGQLGPARNCGFSLLGSVVSCTPGQSVTMTCSGGSATQPAAVRLCEASAMLGAIPCTYLDALAAGVQTGAPLAITAMCPPARSAVTGEPGGTLAVYAAPVIGGDPVAITCTKN